MTNEHKLALERIVALCEKSRSQTMRNMRIHDIALEALGLSANQREFAIRKAKQGAIAVQRETMERRIQAAAVPA